MARLFRARNVILLALCAVGGAAFNLSSFYIHLERNKAGGDGTLECRPAPYGRSASFLWVTRYHIRSDMWHLVKAAYFDNDDEFVPAHYQTVSYRRAPQVDYEQALSAKRVLKYRVEGMALAVTETGERAQWGKTRPDIATLYRHLKDPSDRAAAAATFDFVVHAMVDGRGAYRLVDFAKTVGERLHPMTNAEAMARIRQSAHALARCDSDANPAAKADAMR